MNIKQILDIEKTLGRKLPVDMYSNMSYYSESKREYIDVKALDIVHAVRILRKYMREENEQNIIQKTRGHMCKRIYP